MAVVKATSADVDLLARLLRAEAEGEGKQGMLLVATSVLIGCGQIAQILKASAPSGR